MVKGSRGDHHKVVVASQLALDLDLALDAGGEIPADRRRDAFDQEREAAVRAAERQRLAREVHDSLIPMLYGIALGAERLTELAHDETAREVASYVQDLASTALGEVRGLIFELRPERLALGGLGTALRELATFEARQSVRIAVRVDDDVDCSLPVLEAIYRIAQEALSNVVMHAHATSVRVDLRSEDGVLILEVGDDGVGFDADVDQPGHLGQQSMRERATALGGSLDVASQLRSGTTIRAVIPCSAQLAPCSPPDPAAA
jgi:signal transduction histidine kinase